MEDHWAKIIEAIGEDLERPGLADTPKRAAKAFEFLTRGYGQSVDDVVNNALFPSDSSEMILVQDVELYSLCEHHLLPFIGKCHVAYIPTGKVLGLSTKQVENVKGLLDLPKAVQEAIDDPDDVWRDDSGVWHVRAGADVRVKLTMTAE